MRSLVGLAFNEGILLSHQDPHLIAEIPVQSKINPLHLPWLCPNHPPRCQHYTTIPPNSVIIITYAPVSPYPHEKKKRAKNMTNTRQTDNEHPRWYLIWKDKIRHRPNHNDQSETMCPLEMTSPGTRTWTHRKNSTHGRPSTSPRSTDQHRAMRRTPRWTMTLHTQKETKAYPRPNTHTHDTQDKYLHTLHTISLQSFTSLTLTEELLDRHRYWPGYLTAGKYPHLFHSSIMAV